MTADNSSAIGAINARFWFPVSCVFANLAFMIAGARLVLTETWIAEDFLPWAAIALLLYLAMLFWLLRLWSYLAKRGKRRSALVAAISLPWIAAIVPIALGAPFIDHQPLISFDAGSRLFTLWIIALMVPSLFALEAAYEDKQNK